MLPQVHLVQDDEGDIVLHLHVHRIINGVEPDVIRIAVIGSIHAIIQRQCPFLVGRVAENKFEYPVLILRINLFSFIISFHYFPFKAFITIAVKRKSGSLLFYHF